MVAPPKEKADAPPETPATQRPRVVVIVRPGEAPVAEEPAPKPAPAPTSKPFAEPKSEVGEVEPADPTAQPFLEAKELRIQYADGKVALRGVSFDVREHEIFGIVGPANSGKTSLLRAINRMDELTTGMHVSGQVLLGGRDVRTIRNVYALRRMIGVVFPLPVGLPMSIYDNVAFAPRLAGIRKKAELDVIVERCLTRAALWDEVKDRLKSLGSLLSGGQQQRLTIARALSQEPSLLLLDEFSIAVDPVTTMRIEDILKDLRREMTIILVTNLVQQARRLADRTAFFLKGECIEIGKSGDFFRRKVKDQRTLDYLEGRFG